MGCVDFFFLSFWGGGMTRCDSHHFRCFSCSTSQSVGDLPLRSSRGSHSSRMKSRCFAGASISALIFFNCSPSCYRGVDEFTYLEHRSRSPLKGLYRPDKPKYRMAPSDSTVTLDLVSSTDEAGAEGDENSDWNFWRWFAWHNPQGLWADWKGRRRWWALH
jgi:hypothetical protein